MSAYIGREPTLGNLEVQVLPAFNGTLNTVNLNYAVGSASSLLVVLNGVLQQPSVAYSVSLDGTVLTFAEPPIAESDGYIIYLGKQISVPRAVGSTVDVQSFTGDNVETDFILQEVPVVPEAIIVVVDGLIQKLGSNFTLIGSTLSFVVAPPLGAEIEVIFLAQEKVSIDTVRDQSITRAKIAPGALVAEDVVYTPKGIGAVQTDVEDILDSQLMTDYAALRVYEGLAKTIRVTGLLTTTQPQDIAGFFQFDPTDTTSADNGGTIIVGSDGRRWKRVFSGEVNVKWFGALGDGVNDDTAAIQAAIDFTEQADNTQITFFPAGTYKITDSIWMGSKTDATRRTTLYLRGEGKRYFPVPRGDNTNTTPGTMIDGSLITDRPAVVVQGIFGGKISDMSVLGSGYQVNYDLSLTTIPSTVASWIPAGHTSGRYNPTCAIAVDPYSGPTPAGGYATGIPYNRITSSNVEFNNVSVFGFVVGFGVSINNQGFNGDSLRFNNCNASSNAYNFVICGSQNRDIQYNDCVVSSTHTCWDTETFGPQAGDLGHINGGIVGLSYRVFNVNIEYNANSVNRLYAETIKRVGTVLAISTAISPGLKMQSCYFKEETETAWNDKDPQFFPQGAGFSADSCAFLPKLPWATLWGTSGTASNLIPPQFTNCSFVTFINAGAPNPRPFTRWYVGEFKNLSTARAILENCKFDIFEGNASIAGDFIDSFSCCGPVVRVKTTTLPARQEVVNYTARQLLTRSNVLYNLKNVSTYAPISDNVSNKSWAGRIFTFDSTQPTEYAVGDYLYYGDSSLPLVVNSIVGNTITSESLFGVQYYDTSATFYNAAGFRMTVLDRQFINSGAITGDISTGSNQILNVSNASAFKTGDFIGANLVGSLGFPSNTRITSIVGTTITVTKNATATQVGAAIGNLVCVAAV